MRDAREVTTTAAAVPSLADAFDPRANSLGVLRFVLAFLVIVQHTYELGGLGRDPLMRWTGGDESFGGLAVGGFFVISGFLVTRSLMRSPGVANFVFRRCLRVLPGFWVCLLVTAFGFGTLAWAHEHGTVAGFLGAKPSPVAFVAHNAMLAIRQFGIGGLLGHNPVPHAFNGSLWTLLYEFGCYLGLAALGAAGVLRRSRGAVLAMAAVLAVLLGVRTWGPNAVVSGLHLHAVLLPLAFFFVMGMVLHLWADRVPVSPVAAGVAAVVLVAGSRVGLYGLPGRLAVAYLCLWLAVRLPFHRFGRRADLSYGLYIYAFPVQQLLVLHGVAAHGALVLFGATAVLVLPLAAASWFFVESPFLRLKDMTLVRPAGGRLRFAGRRPGVPH